jgi:hypothetical protein
LYTGSAASLHQVIALAAAAAELSPNIAGELLTSYVYVEVVAGRLDAARSAVDAAMELIPTSAMSLPALLVRELVQVQAGVAGAGGLLFTDWDADLTDAELLDPATPLVPVLSEVLWSGQSELFDRLVERQATAVREAGMLATLGLSDAQRNLLLMLRGEWAAASAGFYESERMLLQTDFTGPLPYV